jgi:hypothetical protein
MNGASSNVFFQSLMAQVKTTENVFHKCPYEGKIEAKNLDMKEDKFFSVYISGLYRSFVMISDKAKNEIFSFTLDAQITTSIKMG